MKKRKTTHIKLINFMKIKTDGTFKSLPWVNDAIVVSVKECNMLFQNALFRTTGLSCPCITNSYIYICVCIHIFLPLKKICKFHEEKELYIYINIPSRRASGGKEEAIWIKSTIGLGDGRYLEDMKREKKR